MAVVTVVVAAIVVLPTSGARAGFTDTFLGFDSDPGDYIGHGVERTWYPVDGEFTVTSAPGLVKVSFDGGPESSDLQFKAPRDIPLEPGPYEAATRYPFQWPVHPAVRAGCPRPVRARPPGHPGPDGVVPDPPSRVLEQADRITLLPA